ncbi:Thioesterase superfamily [Penicillium paradoxum]|uniref:Thioesterase superfamily n=1 Tax=Penicillium paradoxum TaxID=176176 RepID=UPI002546628C|nr:Thioesterase superfamily [Penicillium paradoxum]KAJ5782538.1 Thioesterase superfamily [Penicillium paradoxum]
MATSETQSKKHRKRSDYGFHQVHQTRCSPPRHTTHTDDRFDNDMYAHLNNAVYTHLFDTIANTWLIQECGMDPFSVNNPTPAPNTQPSNFPSPSNLAVGADQIGLIVSTNADFFASVRFPDLLEVGLRVNRLTKSSVTWEVGIFRKGEEDVKMVGNYTHVFVLRETMRVGKTGMEERTRRGLEKLLVKPEAKL